MRLRLRYSHSLQSFVKLTPKRKAGPFCFVEVWGFELQLEEPKSTVLPLYYTSIFLEPLVGIEPTSTDYKSAVITFILKRHSRAAKRNRTSIFSMASWCTNRYTIPANSSFDKHLCQNLEKLTPELYDSWTRAYTIYILCIRLTLLSLKCCTKSAIESKRTQVKPDSYDTKHSADVWSVGARGRRPTDTFTKTLLATPGKEPVFSGYRRKSPINSRYTILLWERLQLPSGSIQPTRLVLNLNLILRRLVKTLINRS